MTIEELMKLRNETVEKIAGKKEFAVSYTHLTLPTIA